MPNEKSADPNPRPATFWQALIPLAFLVIALALAIKLYREDSVRGPVQVALLLAAALAAQVARVKAIHGRAVLFDCHSIRSLIPFLFEGRLPVFNIGTNNGATCAAAVAAAATEVLGNAGDFDMVLNGRFKGGWTTRHYGDPESGVHAIQLEMAQYVYMQETAPWDYLPARADEVRPVLGDLLRRIEALARDGRI